MKEEIDYFDKIDENNINNNIKKLSYNKIINNKKENIAKIGKNNNFYNNKELIFTKQNNNNNSFINNYFDSIKNDNINIENKNYYESNLDLNYLNYNNNNDNKNLYINENENVNNNKIYLKISRFNLIIKGNENEMKMSNYENEKLIKIYEKEIQRLNKKLIEANEKIKEYMKLLINSQSEVYILKDKLNKEKKEIYKNNKNNKIKSKIKYIKQDDNNNIIGRNQNSFLIKLPDSFITFKENNETIQNEKKNNFRKNSVINNHNNSINNLIEIHSKKNNIINSEIYTKKISKKPKRSNSQPNINKLDIDLIEKHKTEIYNESNFLNSTKIKKKISNKLAYIIYPYDKKRKNILYFDIENKQFSKSNYIDFENFNKNYLNSFRNDESENNSIFLMYKNNLYIVTGGNTDIFYVFNSQKNIIKKICNLKNNHANGVLIKFKNKLFCLSGKYNKKVEIYSELKKEWNELSEMNIERSFFSACIINDAYLFCLFGYNTPTNKYLDSIEYYNINNEENGWKYLRYKNPYLLRMNICGFICINFNNNIIIFGGINGIQQNPVKKFYKIIFDKDFENNSFIEDINMTPQDIDKNKCYYFQNGIGQIEDENNNIYYTAFDNNYNLHIIKLTNRIEHEIYYFNEEKI